MEIRREEVRHIAELSKLALREEQLNDTALQLASILTYMKTIDHAYSEDGTAPAALSNVTREDVICPSADRESLLRAVPRRTEDMLAVPKTVE